MAELIAKTSAAVAVDENLITVLDWLDIESVSGFTVVVDNVGGGSANDIVDVQIDTSPDGGATVSTDQHPGVPAVPISSGKAAAGSFTETAAFVRIRAKCAAGQDTTANAHLLADSTAGRICTLADVKDRLGLSDTDYDVVINRIVTGIESMFNGYTQRTLIVNPADVTEYYTGRSSYLQLLRYPLVSIISIKESLTYDFDNETALVANTDYRILAEGKKSVLYRLYMDWPNTPDSIQIVYRGGYCSAGQSPGTGETALPADLREAAIEQASFLFKRRDDIGLAGVSVEGGSISKFSAVVLLPLVKKTLDIYRRPMQ